jgi:hypothetical protein
MRRIAGAHDRRHAELAADDGGVAGAPAVVGHDGGGTLHDRHPVRVGDRGDEHRPVDEAVDVLGALDQADPPRNHRLADAEAGQQLLPRRADPVGLKRPCRDPGLHRLRARLHDQDLAGLAVLGPLHIHRLPVVPLDRDRLAGQREDLVVGEHEGGTLGLGRGHVARGALGAAVEHLALLRAKALLQDRPQARVGQEWLEHLVLVGVHRALDDVLAEPPGGVDQHRVVEAGLRVDREHHPGAAEVRAHHLLHADRQRHLGVIEPLQPPIGDGAVGEEGRVAAPAGVEQRRFAADVQECLLLTGEARVRQVLGGRAGADGHGRLAASRAPRELAIGIQDGGCDIIGPVAADNFGPDRRPGLVQRELAGFEPRQGVGDRLVQPVGREKGAKGVGSSGEARRDPDTLAPQATDHLSERGVLAPYETHIRTREFLEPFHASDISRHRVLRRHRSGLDKHLDTLDRLPH